MNTFDNLASELECNGFSNFRGLFDEKCVNRLRHVTSRLPEDRAVRKRKGVYGVRDLFRLLPDLRAICLTDELRKLLEHVMNGPRKCVRAIYFDKPTDANWRVPWHQDLSIAVRERFDVDGYAPWSVKAGVQHVQPPTDLLSEMLTARIHLDDCGEHNGALEVLPDSHRNGRASQKEILEAIDKGNPHLCEAEEGDVLLMRPLIFHASSPGKQPLHRRVIHLEFSSCVLPKPLEWYEAW